MKCAICGIRIVSIDRAVDQGWIPYFCEGDEEHEVACPACTQVFLQEAEDGKMEVKELYRGKLTYLDDEARKEDSKEDVAIEIFFPRQNEDRRH
jgi:hypothetical protein